MRLFQTNLGYGSGVARYAVAAALALGCIFGAGAARATAVNPPTISKAYEFSTIQVGQIDPLTITIDNSNPVLALSGIAFTDVLPVSLIVTTPSNVTDSCGGTVVATSGTSTISLTGGTIAADSSCTVVVDITGTIGGITTFNTTGPVSSTTVSGGTASNTAELIVTPATTTPEPATFLLVATALGGLLGIRRRKPASL